MMRMRLRHNWYENAVAAMSAPITSTTGESVKLMFSTSARSPSIALIAEQMIRPTSVPDAALTRLMAAVRDLPR